MAIFSANQLRELQQALEELTTNPKKQTRTIAKRFLLTKAEDELLQSRAELHSLSLSDYIRARIFDLDLPRPRPQIPEINRQIYRELSGIGRNLNQIAKRLNGDRAQTIQSTDIELIQTQIATLQANIQEIRKSISNGEQQ